MKNYLLSSIIMLLCMACNDSTDLPKQEFADEYQLADFKLSDAYIYWEIRRGNLYSQEDQADEVLTQFDAEIYTDLSTEQVALLDTADTNNGYDAQCLPEYCPIYGVALLNDSSFVIESMTDLVDFFGDIDTEAELYHLLAIDYSVPETFEENDEGYRVVIAWNNLCGLKGTNLIQVYPDGSQELIKELTTEETGVCV
ncbi:hypothetical protein [Paraglaciecola sp. 2405UD69-4]|uniref:hypothetical protein n=1 Tax=Paraglaciecola sp. 2405UD69-4 TaxID=3391836 RepID=UPI0039C8D859